MKIFIIRHAEGTHNVYGDVSVFDPSLTPKGVTQCTKVRTKLPVVDIVLCSTATRAIQTAGLIFPVHQLYATDLLLEYNTGVSCNSRTDLKYQKNRFPNVDFHTYYVDPLNPEYTWEDCARRAAKVVELVQSLTEHKTIALVSHQNFGQNLAASFGGKPVNLANCGYYEIDIISH